MRFCLFPLYFTCLLIGPPLRGQSLLESISPILKPFGGYLERIDAQKPDYLQLVG